MAKSDKTTNQDEALPSESLQNEARELGIEPSSYHTTQELQERIDQVRAEKEAVGGDTSMTDARRENAEQARASNDEANPNLNSASDSTADNLKSK